MRQPSGFLWFFLVKIQFWLVFGDGEPFDASTCKLAESLKSEIRGYQPMVDKIIEETTKGKLRGSTYDNLAEFVDTFGNRFSGTENLENAIDYMMDKARNDKFDSVTAEEFVITQWIRGTEKAMLLKPKIEEIPVLGLGNSIGTGPEGLSAEVIVVKSFNDLESKKDKIAGKIVVFNEKFTKYGETAVYRAEGADRAAKYGAVAALVRSVTPFSLSTLHTGMMSYSGNYTKIPTAAITIECAKMLYRRQRKGETIKIKLVMMDKYDQEVKTRNTLIDVTGSAKPDAYVVISGHIDSWDVGEGAMDDGGGFMLAYNALSIIKNIDLKPKRTVRAILWSGEEIGLLGAFAYKTKHKSELGNINFLMESDEGTFTPQGLVYAGPKEGGCILSEILKLFQSINATSLNTDRVVGSDISIYMEDGIAGASLLNANDRYFWYHHSKADTMNVENANDLDVATALWAATAYIVADLSVDMPRITK